MRISPGGRWRAARLALIAPVGLAAAAPLPPAQGAALVRIVADKGGRHFEAGCGFQVSADRIYTCYHVVAGARALRITGPDPDGRGVSVRVFAGICRADLRRDLAVLRIVPVTGAGALAWSASAPATGDSLGVWAVDSAGAVRELATRLEARAPSPASPRDLVFPLPVAPYGISGAPVLDRRGRVAGMVHAGGPAGEKGGYRVYALPPPPDRACGGDTGLSACARAQDQDSLYVYRDALFQLGALGREGQLHVAAYGDDSAGHAFRLAPGRYELRVFGGAAYEADEEIAILETGERSSLRLDPERNTAVFTLDGGFTYRLRPRLSWSAFRGPFYQALWIRKRR